jgi:hypothetical protein
VSTGEKTMSYESAIGELESEWSAEGGFFWRIRQGQFVAEDFKRALKKVSAISIPEEAELPRRLVSLLWYVPVFMHWQAERVKESRGDVAGYTKAVTSMTNEIERLLGVP